jgi:hypothetical protein
MSWRPQLNVVCGRCGKPRGLSHVCVSNSRRRQTLKPQLSFGKCPDCKRPYGSNPLAHVCAPKSDFKARKARKKRQQERHDYTACLDSECKRALCVAFKTGWKLGDQAGYERGWQQGYDRGFPDGIAACPREHK